MADKVYLTPTPGSTGHGGGERDHIRLQLKGLSFCHRKRRTVERPLCCADIVYK